VGDWMKLLLALSLATLAATPAHTTPQDAAAKAREAKLSEVVEAVSVQQAQKAVDLATPLLAEYERTYAGDTHTLFCDVEDYETAAYAGLPGGKNARIVEGGWCIALWAKGFALIDLDRLDAAVPFLERAVAMAPFHPHYLSELGYAYQTQKHWQLSYDHYARAAEWATRESGERQKKSLRRAWFGMAYDLIELGRLDEAEALFRKCLELVPNDQKVRDELDYIAEQRAKKKG
jgi:tetratricopeptide (TPR) repeat protein